MRRRGRPEEKAPNSPSSGFLLRRAWSPGEAADCGDCDGGARNGQLGLLLLLYFMDIINLVCGRVNCNINNI